MSQEESRQEVLGARSLAGEGGGFATPSTNDPSTEPTISSTRIDSNPTRPTHIDPDVPFRRSETATASGRPSARNHVALPVGCQVYEYTIEAVLGSGGFGITYRARDNNLQCEVAIKEYLPNDLAVRAAGQTVCPKTESDTHGYRIGLDGFLAEARVLASFRHPHIVRVTRFFEANNTAYMVMDYERGEPLRDWIKQQGSLDEKRLLQMFLPLLDGLEVVHKARVLHRDIKPANIYVREDGDGLVLLDFGAARYARSDDSRSLTSIVTPGYAPFEQYHTHGAQGPWSDLYAFGGVLYWIVSGEKPQEAPSRVKKDTMRPALSAGKGRYSERLLRAIDWALNPDEVDRPKSVSQFREVLTGEKEIPPPFPDAPVARSASPAVMPPRRKPLLAFGFAAAIVLAGSWAAFYPKAKNGELAAGAGQAPAVPLVSAPTEAEVKSEARPPEPKKTTVAAKRAGRTAVHDQSVGTSKAASEVTKGGIPAASAEPVATVLLMVAPRGEIILDGKRVGESPPLNKLAVSAGKKHKLEIHSFGTAPSHYWTIELAPGETREISANFER